MLDEAVEQPTPWRARTTGTASTAGNRREEAERDAACAGGMPGIGGKPGKSACIAGGS